MHPLAMNNKALDAEDDTGLVQRCQRGEAMAWAALVRRYERLLHAIVRHAGLDEHTAADVFQTVFSRLLDHLPRLREPQHLQAWLVTTAKRECLALRARAAKHVPLPDAADANEEAHPEWELADEGPTAEAMLEALQQQHSMRLALARLDERCRSLLTLLFADEDEALAYTEVSRRLGLPVGSIGPTRARCLAKLRQLLG